MENIIKLLKCFFLFMGIGLLIGSFFLYKNTREFVRGSITVPGIVIEIILRDKTDSDGNRGYTHVPLILFETKRGEKVTFESEVSSSPSGYEVDEVVKVLYQPENPQDAKIKSFGSLWLTSLILFLMGLVMLLFFYVLIAATRLNEMMGNKSGKKDC